MVSLFSRKEKSGSNDYIELIQIPKIVPMPTQGFVDKLRNNQKIFFEDIKRNDFLWLLRTLNVGRIIRMPFDEKKIEVVINISTNQSSPNEDKRCYVMTIKSSSSKKIYLRRFSYDWIYCDLENYFHGYYRESNVWKDVFDIVERHHKDEFNVIS